MLARLSFESVALGIDLGNEAVAPGTLGNGIGTDGMEGGGG